MNLRVFTRYCIRSRLRYWFIAGLTLYFLEFFGFFIHFMERNFYTDFHYPADGDVLRYATQLRDGQPPDRPPINLYNFTYVINPRDKCRDNDGNMIEIRLVILVKSATDHFEQRLAIRKSWGFEGRFSDVEVRTVFMTGLPTFDEPRENYRVQSLIDDENTKYGDVVQSNFADTYYNNTIKTMRGIQWAVENCRKGKFFLFVDDDYYVSAKNVLRFIKDPVHYPEYLEEADETIRELSRKLANNHNGTFNDKNLNDIKDILSGNVIHTIQSKNDLDKIKKSKRIQDLIFPKVKTTHETLKRRRRNSGRRQKRFVFDRELSNDVRLFSGYVISSRPQRHKTSKWRVTLEEYPWHMYPTYVTAGAFVLSREAIIDMYYVSKFTQHFRWVSL